MLRKFIVEVKHYATHDSLESKDVKRDHIVYMPESEYDTSGSRWKNRRWVENKIEAKLGERYVSGEGSKYFIQRIYQERL
tara:strand:+ start:122 stop:361 length:240 start_codon:yes stop_codon:yes gene_type:complete